MYKINGQLQAQRVNKLLGIKGVREIICCEHVKTNIKLSKLVIQKYGLKRINNKYILRIRQYDENYYVRERVKEEEIIFAKKMLLFTSYEEQLDKLVQQERKLTALIRDQYEDDYTEEYSFITTYIDTLKEK